MQGKTTELQQMLKQKEMEIERLQQQLESKKSSGSSDSSVDVCAAVELDEDPSAAYATEVGSPPWQLLLATKNRKEKATPFNVNSLGSQVLYWAAQILAIDMQANDFVKVCCMKPICIISISIYPWCFSFY